MPLLPRLTHPPRRHLPRLHPPRLHLPRLHLPILGRPHLGRSLAVLLGAALSVGACRFEQPRDDGQGGAGGAGGAGSGGAGGGAPLTIVTWNVHNLLNEKLDANLEFEDVDPDYDAHRAAVAKVLDQLDADVLVLQEIEHTKVLDELNQDLAAPYPHRALIEGNDPRGVDIAVLSRVALDATVSHQDEKFTKQGTNSPLFTYSRDCLEVHLTVNGRALVLLGVHFKSKDTDNPDKRLAEAQHTRLIADAVQAEASDAGILVLGDFNDLPGSLPYDAVAGSAPRFENAADLVPTADRWSFDYNNKLELVDHQLANPLLFGMLDPGSARIPHTKDVEAASDHAPIVATYLVR